MTHYQKQKQYKQQRTVPEIIILGLGRALWWLLTLPFHKGKRRRTGISEADKRYVSQKRSEIEQMALSENIYELKHAVIEADKLVDYVLKAKGYHGETFADRLRSAESNIDHAVYQRLWDAHKLRNQIAHQDNHISEQAMISAVKILLNYARF